MPDVIETLWGATVQHGSDNNRVYLMEPGSADTLCLPGNLLYFARERGYTKVFATVPASKASAFLAQGYRVEARVPRFHNGLTDGLFLGAYLSEERKHLADRERLEHVIEVAQEKAREDEPATATGEVQIRECAEDDIPRMAALYEQVFDTYPFPIQERDYLAKTMRSHVRYFGAYADDSLLALSSAEMHRDRGNVEMTDFATCPAARGRGLASCLLLQMDHAMAEAGFKTAYTIARARSIGMSTVFAKGGYNFAGTLVNNTQIAGHIESMNVWYKPMG